MRYLGIVLVAGLLVGCLTGGDGKKETLGLSVGWDSQGGNNRSELLVVDLKKTQSYMGHYSVSDSILFRVSVPDSFREAYWNYDAMRDGISKYQWRAGQTGVGVSDTLTVLMLIDNKCVTWDQTKYKDKVPCLPVLEIVR